MTLACALDGSGYIVLSSFLYTFLSPVSLLPSFGFGGDMLVCSSLLSLRWCSPSLLCSFSYHVVVFLSHFCYLSAPQEFVSLLEPMGGCHIRHCPARAPAFLTFSISFIFLTYPTPLVPRPPIIRLTDCNHFLGLHL
ncbi:hypothetical protein BCR44DRAFT_1435366, partial [Catenaria anguillulae PL171]